MLVHGNLNPPLVLLADTPLGSEAQTQKPFSSSGSELYPLALHQNRQGYNDCLSLTLLDRPYHFERQHDDYFTTVKKHGAERGWQPVQGGFASAELLKAQAELLATLDQLPQEPTVLACGELALWALTGEDDCWLKRGSIYQSVPLPSGKRLKVICTLSPAKLQAAWDMREVVKRDIERAVTESRRPGGFRWPDWHFTLQAGLHVYTEMLNGLYARLQAGPLRLGVDIETIRHEIACIGIAWSPLEALCIPIRTSFEYWSVEEELLLISLVRQVLEHPNARIVGQNFHYDSQYLSLKWGIAPRCTDDTMVAQHLLFLGMPKTLYFIASLYCDFYQYWKDDLKDYKKAPTDDNKFFSYNCRDCCYTLEAMNVLDRLLDRTPGMREKYNERMRELWPTVLRMTLRGVRVNTKMREKLSIDLLHAAMARQEFLDTVIGRPFNPQSPKQMREFFYNEMGVKPQKSRITKKPSLGAEILQQMPEDYPLLAPITDTIIEMRSLKTFRSTFIESPLDDDARVRSFFAMCGTETTRFASGENAFGRGMNLQNVSKGDRARTRLAMPNVREMFVPDPGFMIVDIDLAGADAQVVAWEANDPTMKQLFKEKKTKIAAFAAREIFGTAAGSDGKTEPYYTRAKMGGHATNYGAWPTTVAKALGISVHEADKFQKKWFGVFPGILQWHTRIQRDLDQRQEVINAFGYRKHFFGRTDKALPEALAWGPQSTVAVVTNKALAIIDQEFDMVQLLMQVHDSIVFQLLRELVEAIVPQVLKRAEIVIPYPDPLIIPWGCKYSSRSWGECG